MFFPRGLPRCYHIALSEVVGKKLSRDGSGAMRRKPVVMTCPSASVFCLPNHFLQILFYLLRPHSLLPGEGPVGLYHFWGKVKRRVLSPKYRRHLPGHPSWAGDRVTGMETTQSLPSGASGSKRRSRKANRPIKQCGGKGLEHI